MSAASSPSPVGGPGQVSAKYVYPAQADQDFQYQFNYKDTVNVSWESYTANSSAITLQLFYWLPGDNGPWRPLDLHVVPANGSLSFKLDSLSVAYRDRGYYLGQWNLNFTRQDEQPVSGLIVSQTFHCDFDDSKPARTFSQSSVVTTPPMAVSANDGTATTSNAVSSSSLMTVSTSPGTANDQTGFQTFGLSGGAIAGIVAGSVIVTLAVCAISGFFLFRRMKKNMTEAEAVKRLYPKLSSENGEVGSNVHTNPSIYEIHSRQNNGFDASRSELSEQAIPVEAHGRELPLAQHR